VEFKMRGAKFLLSASAALALIPACAHAEEAANGKDRNATEKKAEAAQAPKSFSTGVARGRDLLDSAISTSGLNGADLEKYSARTIGEILRNIPGLRVEYHSDDAQTNITVRGLPLAGTGNKYIQI
jgi:outer membrane receptor for Fe3+-dicitrate